MSSLKVTGFAQLDDDAQEDALRTVARPNGAWALLEEQIAAFEERYGMTSEEMRRQLSDGELEESWEICQWLFLLRHRDGGARASRAE